MKQYEKAILAVFMLYLTWFILTAGTPIHFVPMLDKVVGYTAPAPVALVLWMVIVRLWRGQRPVAMGCAVLTLIPLLLFQVFVVSISAPLQEVLYEDDKYIVTATFARFVTNSDLYSIDRKYGIFLYRTKEGYYGSDTEKLNNRQAIEGFLAKDAE